MPTEPSRKSLRRPTRFLVLTRRGMVAAALVLGLLNGAQADEHTLGRLFFTPDQRAALERQRHTRAIAPRRPAAAAVARTLSVDGVVRRSSGKNTVWVNGAPVPEGRSAVGPAPRISGRNPGVVILRSGRRGSTSIRVGETLDLRPDPSEASPTGPNAQAGGRAGKSRE